LFQGFSLCVFHIISPADFRFFPLFFLPFPPLLSGSFPLVWAHFFPLRQHLTKCCFPPFSPSLPLFYILFSFFPLKTLSFVVLDLIFSFFHIALFPNFGFFCFFPLYPSQRGLTVYSLACFPWVVGHHYGCAPLTLSSPPSFFGLFGLKVFPFTSPVLFHPPPAPPFSLCSSMSTDFRKFPLPPPTPRTFVCIFLCSSCCLPFSFCGLHTLL